MAAGTGTGSAVPEAPTAGSARPRIALHGVSRTFQRRDGREVRAVDDVSLEVAEGEFLVLLGPSGCGKTTLLRVLAGLEQVRTGRVELDGRTVEDADTRVSVPTERRRVSMMFQSYALWPHKTVAQNVEYPLAARRIGRAERAERVARMLAAVGIGELAGQHPGQLSGGQQQRVALARALVAGDGIVLFDEPLSNVDAIVREQLRVEVRRLHRELGFTAVYVTHDQEEALTLATRLLVLREGRIAQSGTPREVYHEPADGYVARFMGAGNEVPGRRTGDGTAETELGPVRGRSRDGSGLADGDAVIAFSRPEDWRLGDPPAGTVNSWPGTVAAVTFLGSCTDRTVELGAQRSVRVRALGAAGPDVGDRVTAWLPADTALLLPDDGGPVGPASTPGEVGSGPGEAGP